MEEKGGKKQATRPAGSQAVGHDTHSLEVLPKPSQTRGPDAGTDSGSNRVCMEDEADTEMIGGP